MAVVRDIEPWDELLAAGREDERLVMQAAQNRRAARDVALPEELHPEVAEALLARRARRQARAAGDLRRRHPARAAGADPPARERDPHEPGHAAPGHPAQPP